MVSLKRRRGHEPARYDHASPVTPPEDLQADLDTIGEILTAVAEGDLEQRVPPVLSPGMAPLRASFNRVLDVIDAYVRESGATLAAAAEGRYHRQLLTRGLPGAYRVGAERIDSSRRVMARTAAELADQERLRHGMVQQAAEVSTHVAAASTELGASAAGLADSARAGVAEVSAALATVQALEETSARIGEAVGIIHDVAARTRLLALNATIESAHVGEAGRGFAVVAGEVKTLADETAHSSADIEHHVAEAQRAVTEVAEAIARISAVIRTVDESVAGIAAAAGDGDAGLALMAETLRSEIGRMAEPERASDAAL